MILLLAGSLGTALLATAPEPARATNVQNSALACHFADQPPSSPPPDLRYQTNGVYNAGTSYVEVVCPVTWVPTYNYPGYFEIFGDTPGGTYTWGTVLGYGYDGTFHAAEFFDNGDYWGWPYYVGWAPLLASSFWDIISLDVVIPPGGRLRGISALQ